MILSASRHTDIPAQYLPWLCNRLREGYALVRNPMAPHRVSRVPLTHDVLDAMVLWSKNPLPLLHHLNDLRDVPYDLQFTLTPYGRDIEPNLPDKRTLLKGFVELARILGPERLVWRYDPILLNAQWTKDVHISAFSAMAKHLAGCTDTCVVSFLDQYRCMQTACAPLQLISPFAQEMQELFLRLSAIAADYGMRLCTCCEDIPDAPRSSCIDKARLERILGCSLSLAPDKNQRPSCGCFESIDIGAYDTCANGCLYCYATHSRSAVQRNLAAHDPRSPLLFGMLSQQDVVTERRVMSCKMQQISLF